ncbi:MAG: hypothetical protein KGJ02_02265, partial [Verrucomicrobiota bacterium]|nr:hypothetical protein [Verrucomicrobiota bacterium]
MVQESGDGKEAPAEYPSGASDHCVSQGASEEGYSAGKADDASSRFLNHERYIHNVTQNLVFGYAGIPTFPSALTTLLQIGSPSRAGLRPDGNLGRRLCQI